MKVFRPGTLVLALAAASPGMGETGMTHLGGPDANWEFISDQVMGGVSTGRAQRESAGEERVLRLQGRVSTENNGGFIQARLDLPQSLPAEARGIVLEVRGNDQTYYVHARTTGTVLPWNFYQASYEVSRDWQELRISFSDFEAQGLLLRKSLAPERIESLAIVAYGRDHDAEISLRSIGYY